ncbi:hypothetical protein Q7P37_001669 [Cladosporium fusiforme]
MARPNANIPVINISPSNPNAPQELLSAASEHGFVFIENNPETGLPPQDIARIFDLSKDFFAAPTEVKEEVAIASNKAGKNLGWLSRGIEKLDPKTQKSADAKEAFNIGPPLPNLTLDQPLPTPLAPHLKTITTFQTNCHNLCQQLLKHFATALQTPPDWFTSRHDQSKGPSGTVFRMLYYPAIPSNSPQDATDLRAGAHSDFGSLTLLFQLPGQPGLEILTPQGEWASVPVDPRADRRENGESARRQEESAALPILVNIGDLLEDWTAGLLKSTRHRVIFPKPSSTNGSGNPEPPQDRYSLAYFCHPLDDARLEPVPSKAVQAHAQSKAAAGEETGTGRVGMTAKEHLMEKLGATYSVTK